MKAVAGIVRRQGAVLLIKQQGRDAPGPSWALPGGRVEDGEDLLTALHREVREETGLAVQSAGRLAWAVEVTGNEASYVAFAFEITVHDGPLAPNDPDGVILDARYVPIQEAIRLVGETLPWPQMREPLLAYLQDAGASTIGSFYHYDNRAPAGTTQAAL